MKGVIFIASRHTYIVMYIEFLSEAIGDINNGVRYGT